MADPVCAAGSEDGFPGACFDGTDNSADGLIDRFDPSCNATENGGPAGSCFDSADNSADGRDQMDPECAAMREDGFGVGSCFNGINDSNPFNFPWRADQQADGADPDCQVVEDGRPGATCYNMIDDGADGLSDAADPACMAQVENLGPAGSCYDGADNSGDGDDVNDPECNALRENNGPAGSCYDTLDNIFDGADLADPDCTFAGGWASNDDFIIYNRDAASLMHEFGHTLGLSHGGKSTDDPHNCKPNYVSVMNYSYAFGISQLPGRGLEAGVFSVFAAEDGGAAGTCFDGVDNGGNDGIDLFDPDCQLCNNLIDENGDLRVDGNDPNCLGLDVDGDGQPDSLAIDYSPPVYPGGRASLLPPLIELGLNEPQALVAIDTNADLIQDTYADPTNMIAYSIGNPAGVERAGVMNSCSDTIDNDGDGFPDALDTDCVSATMIAPVFGVDTTLDGFPDGIDWNGDMDALDGPLVSNIDSVHPLCGGNSRFLNGLNESSMGGCGNMTDDDGDVDAADGDCQHNDYDDWASIHLPTWANSSGATPPAPTSVREPTTEELQLQLRRMRTVDLFLDAVQTTVPVAVDGSVTLQLRVENFSATPAFGPVRLVVQGVPDGVTLATAQGQCMRSGVDVVCQRGWIDPHQTWSVDLRLEHGDACTWLAHDLHASVVAAGGDEARPEDNELDIAIQGSGVWPMWKLCGSRTGSAPYPGPTASNLAFSRNLSDEIRSSIVIANDGSLFVTTEDGRLYGLEASGTIRWQRNLGSDVTGSAALLPNGLVVAATRLGAVGAYRPADGTREWLWNASSRIEGSPAVGSDGRIYVGTGLGVSFNNSVVALTPTGSVAWRANLSTGISASPALGPDGRVYVTSEGGLSGARLFAISPAGSVLWSTPVGNSSRSSPAVRAGRVYVGNEDAQLIAVDANSGAVAWTYSLGCTPILCAVRSSPAVNGSGRVFFGAQNGRVYAVQDNGTSATLAWSYLASGSMGTPIVSSNGVVYVGSSSSRLYALQAASGAELFRVQTSDDVLSTPALDSAGRLYFGSDDGYLRAYGP